MRSLLLLVLALAACHETDDGPEVNAAFGDTGLALSCEANLTCEEGVCDPATLDCVDCLADADCAEGRCHPRDHVCVQCVGDGDCRDAASGQPGAAFCHPTRAICVGCFDDSQCDKGVCNPDKLACVECMSDRDCPSGHCNRDTFACVGGCVEDAQCADRNPCTGDRCEDGACRYAPVPDASNTPCDDGVACTARDHCRAGICKGEPTDACCEPLTCKPDQHPIDGDRDGCNDRCECGPMAPCVPGTTPFDQNGGGCPDACLCPSGAVIGPDGQCPCPVEIRCDGGLVPSDLDGDNCPDTCAKPCGTACDCQAQGLVASTPCPLDCATCGAFLECFEGHCVGRCGVIPERECACPPAPTCGPLETAFDSDADGCNDDCRCVVDGPNGCACPTTIACTERSSPVDLDGDGCPDTCRCDDPASTPRPDGNCCPKIECPAGQVPVDKQGDSCPDACLCQSGDVPSFTPPVCPCKPLECPAGSEPIDDDHDACPDRCQCQDGSAPGPAGCESCLSECGADLPVWQFFVDHDGDGCYDELGECPIGAQAKRSPGAGCPDFCQPCAVIECPKGGKPVDSDADRCPDRCVCEDGSAAPEAGCPCTNVPVCFAPAVPVDLDRNGCADGCRTPCTTACDCGSVDLVAACDCAGCEVHHACVDGFCSAGCSQAVDACLAPAGDPVCGCDAKTYESRCDANAAGVDVRHVGGCDLGCGTDADCANNQHCERAGGECNATAVTNTATCVEVPTSCIAASDPVCGCDGKTYANDCERLRAGVGRSVRGACAVATPR